MKFEDFVQKRTSENETMLASYSNERYFALLTKYKERYSIYHRDNYICETRKCITYSKINAYNIYYNTISLIEHRLNFLRLFDVQK